MTETTTETRTAAEELRAAATTLRCDHSFPCQPPHGSIARPGACSKCGVHFLDALDVPDALTEPLAAWLEDEVNGVERVFGADATESLSTRALAVARAINGDA